MTAQVRFHGARSVCKPQHGLAMVEFTIAAPLLLLLLYAIAEFGNMLYEYSLLADAARDADRYLASKALGDNSTGVPVITGPLTTATQKLVVYGNISGTDSTGNPLPPLLPGLAVGQVTVATQPDASGVDVTVSVAYPYQSLFGGSIPNFVSPGTTNTALTLNVFTSMRPL